MRQKIIYRHWQPGDDDAILELLLPAEQVDENIYRNKDIEAEGIRLALINERVVGHVWGEPCSFFIEDKCQRFVSVGAVFVAQDMRRQGIAARLMQDLHTHFQRKGYRGSILDADEEAAIRLYQKVGYQQLTQDLQTQLPPNQNASQLKWAEVNLSDLSAIPQLDEMWAKQNFPVSCHQQSIKVHQYTMSGYRILRQDQNIVGYARWDEPSEYYRHGLIRDPIAPDMDPMEVIASIQSAIPTTRTWQTAEGGRYEAPLRAYGCTFEPTTTVIMLSSFGQEIDLTEHHRAAWW
ncbi:MAG: GNAT family N-acetyltransferase [Candidatus Poribacteria bacterium]|nr:GNAT family N-acetyltransferase [Candidatus Poribacteria bacterium]